MKASSGINAVNTAAQAAYLVENSIPVFTSVEEISSFIADTTKSYTSSEDSLYTEASDPPAVVGAISADMIASLASESASAIDFIETRGGLELPRIAQLGGHARPRTHRPARGSVGAEIIKSLSSAVKSEKYAAYITSRLHTSLTSISPFVADDESVSEKDFKLTLTLSTREDKEKDAVEHFLDVHAVVLTTGGFAANNKLIAKYNPKLAALHLPTTNGPWAQGEALAMVEALGGTVIGADKVQVHPTSFVDPANREAKTNFLAPEALRGVGGLLLNRRGERFANELSTRDLASRRIYDQEGHVAALVMSKASATEFGLPVLGFYASKGFIKVVTMDMDAAKTGDASFYAPLAAVVGEFLASETPIKAETVASAFDEYRTCAKEGKMDPFGRTAYHLGESYGPSSQEFYVMAVTPALHYTMGGVEVDPFGRVLKTVEKDEKLPIEGVYAAGEATGGLHGNNRLGGNSLLECVVFGIRAGEVVIKDIWAGSNRN